MIGTPMSYFLYGVVLVVVFGGIIFYNYSRKNHDKIEQAKFNMLEDDDES